MSVILKKLRKNKLMETRKRKWKCRLKNNLCWDCNIPFKKLSTHYGRKCLQCGFIFQEILLNKYKEVNKIII